MNYCKRALLSVWKRKGKNLLLLVAFCVIATLMLACISIRTAAAKAEADAKTKLGSSVSLDPDWSKVTYQKDASGNSSRSAPPISMDIIKSLGKIPHVKSVNYDVESAGVASGFKVICDEQAEQSVADQLKSEGHEDVNIMVTGVNDTSTVDKFTSGEDKLTSGRHINKNDDGKDVTMIEAGLAEKNGLKIGDKIKILCIDDQAKFTGKSVELTIVGIFEAPPATGFDAQYALQNPSDDIFTPMSAACEMNHSTDAAKATFFLDSPASIDSFKTAASKIPGTDKFILDAHDDEYKQMTGPLQNVAGFTNGMVIFIIIASCLILCLISVLSVKNRKQEFGILLAIGEKKLKIVSQMALEALLPMILAVCLAIPFGNAIAQGMGSSLLDGQVQAAEQQKQNSGDGITKNADGAYVATAGLDDESKKDVKPIDSIDVAPTPDNYRKLSLLCLLIVVLSASVPAISVYRQNPRDILIKNK